MKPGVVDFLLAGSREAISEECFHEWAVDSKSIEAVLVGGGIQLAVTLLIRDSGSSTRGACDEL